MEGDDEKIQMMMSFAEEELDRRKKSFSQKGNGTHRIIVKVTVMSRPFSWSLIIIRLSLTVMSNMKYIIQLSREGASYGIYLIITRS